MTVIWTETAREHLDEIFHYIARDSTFYAKRMVDRLTRRSTQIAHFPFSGREVPEYRLKQIRQVIEGVIGLSTTLNRKALMSLLYCIVLKTT